MAEFLNQPKRPSDPVTEEGMAAMGKPIPLWRKIAADRHMKDMGVTSALKRLSCIGAVANRLERDEPYEAMGEGMRYLDLIGTYRLFAVLLAEPKPADWDGASPAFPHIGAGS